MEISEYSLQRVCGKSSSSNVILLKDPNREYTCGRIGINDIICSHRKISKRHCVLTQADNSLFVKDVGSTNGVFINGSRIEADQKVPVKEGDIISLSTEDVETEDETEFIYRVCKQVFVHLDGASIKTEPSDENSYSHVAPKLSKVSDEESITEASERMAVEKLEAVKDMKIGPSAVTYESDPNQSCLKMNIELCIMGNKGMLPNIHINQSTSNPHVISIAMEPSMKQENAIKTELEENPGINSMVPHLTIAPTASQFTTKPTLSQLAPVPAISQVTAPPVSQFTTKPTLSLATVPTISQVTAPPISQFITKPTLSQLVTDLASSRVTAPPVSQPTTKPTLSLLATAPAISQVTAPPISQVKDEVIIIDFCDDDDELAILEDGDLVEHDQTAISHVNAPPVSQITTKPTLSLATAPAISQVTAPPVSQFITKPTLSQLATGPTISQVTAPSVSQLTTKPTLSLLSTAPAISQVTAPPIFQVKDEDIIIDFCADDDELAILEDGNLVEHDQIAISHVTAPPVSQFTTKPTLSLATTPAISQVTAPPISQVKDEAIIIDLCDDADELAILEDGDLVEHDQTLPGNKLEFETKYNVGQQAQLENVDSGLNIEIVEVPENISEKKYDVCEQVQLDNVTSETDIEILEVSKKGKKKKSKEKKRKKRKKEKKRRNGETDEKKAETVEKIEENEAKKVEKVEENKAMKLKNVEETKAQNMETIDKKKVEKRMIANNLEDGAIYSSSESRIVEDLEMKRRSTQDFRLSPQMQLYQVHISSTKSQIPNYEALCQKIVSWDPQAFADPCNSKEDKLTPILKSYESYEDYCSAFLPLITLEVFHAVKCVKDAVRNVSFASCEIVQGSVQRVFVNQKFADFVKFQIKISSKTQASKFPKLGDLLRLDIMSTNVATSTILFGYILCHQSLTPKKDPRKEEAYLEGLYTIVTKQLNFNAYRSKIFEVRVVLNLLHFMKLVDGMDYLQKSPLMPFIIKPEPKNYQLLFSNLTTTLVSKDELDDKQLNAVQRITAVAVRREPKVILIEGPPGTGKTQVIVNIILQLLNDEAEKQQDVPVKILVCASTEPAVDEIVLRISSTLQHLESSEQRTVKMIRLGILHQMDPKTRMFSLKEMSKKYLDQSIEYFSCKEAEMPEDKLMIGLTKEIEKIEKLIRQGKNLYETVALPALEKYLEIKRDGRMIGQININEYEETLRKIKQVYLAAQNLIICSLFTCYSQKMDAAFGKKNLISVCIIDEATLVNEVNILKLLSFGVQTLVLVGDSHKRSTKYLSSTLKKLGVEDSLFSRIKKNFTNPKDCPIMFLDQEYRMNPEIAHFPNSFFYEGILTNRRTKWDQCSISSYKMFNFKILNVPEGIETSFAVNLILCIIKYANLKNVTKPLSIAVVVPYNMSKLTVAKAIDKELAKIPKEEQSSLLINVDTISGFLNQERDIVFASCIDQKGIQFMTGQNRLYSTLTIARHCLVLYGQFQKLQENSYMWNSLIENAECRKVFVDIDCDADFSKLKEHMF